MLSVETLKAQNLTEGTERGDREGRPYTTDTVVARHGGALTTKTNNVIASVSEAI